MDHDTQEKDNQIQNEAPMSAMNGEAPQNEAPMSATNGEEPQNEAPMSATKERTLDDKRGDIFKGILFIVISAFFYSLMSLFVRLAGDLPTFQKAFFRNVVAALFGAALLLKSGSFKWKKGSLPALLGRSIAGTVGILCNFYAIDHMNISDASILNKLAPFASIVFSIWVLGEKPSWKDLLLVGVAFAGALFVVKPSLDIFQSLPALVGVVGGLSAGLAYTFVRKLGTHGERTAVIVFFFSAFSCVSMLPMAILEYEPMTFAQVGFLLLAGLSAGGAQFAVTKAYTFAPAKEVSVYDYSQVLFAAVWGILFLSQFPDWWSLVGYVVIIGAAVIKYVWAKRK